MSTENDYEDPNEETMGSALLGLFVYRFLSFFGPIPVVSYNFVVVKKTLGKNHHYDTHNNDIHNMFYWMSQLSP